MDNIRSVYLWGSTLEIIAESIDGVICISQIRDKVFGGKLGKDTPDESIAALEKNL